MPPHTRQAASNASKSPKEEEPASPVEVDEAAEGGGIVERLTSPTAKPARPARKRGREGSSEPGSLLTAAPSTSSQHLAIKKNRVIAADDDTGSVTGGEAGNVVEVRRKVAKMNWKEGDAPIEDNAMSVKSSKAGAEDIVEDEAEQDDGMGPTDGSISSSGELVEGVEADQPMETPSEPPTSAKSLQDQPMQDQIAEASEQALPNDDRADEAAAHPAPADTSTDSAPNTAAAAAAAGAVVMEEDKDDGSGSSGEAEAGRKRKLVERHSNSAIGTESDIAKRLKEDAPAEPAAAAKASTSLSATPTETATDAPSVPASAPLAATPAASSPVAKKPLPTFGSFASSASPFAAAKTGSAFGSQPAASSSASSFAPAKQETSVFGGAASSTSTASPLKPINKAFGGWAATASPFATPAKTKSAATDEEKAEAKETKDAENKQDSGSGSGTFGDILASDKGVAADTDEQKRLDVQEKDHQTGEEEDDTVYQVRAKLFVMEGNGGWKERGTGTLHLNVRRSDGKSPRLVMRAEGVLRLILNVALFAGMKSEVSGDRYVKATMFEDGQLRSFLMRLGSAKAATELQERILDYLPYEAGKSARQSESLSPSAAQDTSEQGKAGQNGDDADKV